MTTYVLNGPKEYQLIPQKGVRQFVHPDGCIHNAIWDSAAGPDGKMWYGLATEIATSGYVRLCSWDYHTQEQKEHFRVEDIILPQDKAIRPSKFHSSICFMPDGKMIMTTHTTDRSPRHPTWMPLAYYHHLWEGFAGGHILTYDPKTGHVDNLGCPVPHESIYGSVYEPETNSLFFAGWIRGYLYHYSLDRRRVTTIGKTSPNNAFRLVVGSDHMVYGASRSGWLYRVDPHTLRIEDLDFQFRHEVYDHHSRYNDMTIGRIGPDGRLYMAVMYCRSFYALDPKTGKVEDLGHYLPADRYSPDENRNGVFGMDFDSKGVLWYVVTGLNNYEENLEYGIPAGLFRWDVTRGGHPEFLGVVGTKKRACAWNSEVACTKDDILYITGSNHSLDPPDITGIDLKEFDTAHPCSGGLIEDGYYDKNDPKYIRCAMQIEREEEIAAENPTDVQLALACEPVQLWRALAPDHIEDSAVKHLFWDGSILRGVCGEEHRYVFAVQDGRLSELRPWEELTAAEQEAYRKPDMPAVPEVKLPHKAGRQYLAKASAAVKMADGKMLVGTKDGLLALIREDGTVFSLGAPCTNGPVHALSATPDGQTVYGVSGHEDDITSLFVFDEKNGLHELGYMGYGGGMNIDALSFMSVVHTCAVSPDGTMAAVGADERIGCIMIYHL